jgi:hypothetical protein
LNQSPLLTFFLSAGTGVIKILFNRKLILNYRVCKGRNYVQDMRLPVGKEEGQSQKETSA